MEVTESDIGNLRHMLGAVPGRYPKNKWGWRNHYCAPNAGEDSDSMQRLVAAGLAVQGCAQSNSTFYHATEAGCKAVGMSKAAIRRMMDDC